MRAIELRIGNYVYDIDNDILQIGEILDIGVKFKNTSLSSRYSKIKPIPLTEEWLLRFGFDKDDTGVDIYDQDYHEWYQKEFPIIGELCQSFDKTYLFDTNTDTLRIKHVHQLQNLIFALTGEELTVNL